MKDPSFDGPPLSSLDDMAISSAMSPQEPAAWATPAKGTSAKVTVASTVARSVSKSVTRGNLGRPHAICLHLARPIGVIGAGRPLQTRGLTLQSAPSLAPQAEREANERDREDRRGLDAAMSPSPAMWLAFGSGKARGASNIGSDTERGRGLNSEPAPGHAGHPAGNPRRPLHAPPLPQLPPAQSVRRQSSVVRGRRARHLSYR